MSAGLTNDKPKPVEFTNPFYAAKKCKNCNALSWNCICGKQELINRDESSEYPLKEDNK